MSKYRSLKNSGHGHDCLQCLLGLPRELELLPEKSQLVILSNQGAAGRASSIHVLFFAESTLPGTHRRDVILRAF